MFLTINWLFCEFSRHMSHWWILVVFVFIVLLECIIKAFRVCHDSVYVINPDNKIMVAIRKCPENWCIRKSKCCADWIAKLESFQKASNHYHNYLRALDHFLFSCMSWMLCVGSAGRQSFF
jgi:hypothetical protein